MCTYLCYFFPNAAIAKINKMLKSSFILLKPKQNECYRCESKVGKCILLYIVE